MAIRLTHKQTAQFYYVALYCISMWLKVESIHVQVKQRCAAEINILQQQGKITNNFNADENVIKILKTIWHHRYIYAYLTATECMYLHVKCSCLSNLGVLSLKTPKNNLML